MPRRGEKRGNYKRIDMDVVMGLYEDGASVTQIAKLLDRHTSSVSYAIKRAKGETGRNVRQLREKIEKPGSRASANGNGGEVTGLSRSGGFYKGQPPARVIRIPEGVTRLRKPAANMDSAERRAFKNLGIGETYSLSRRLAANLDALWRGGETEDIRKMAGEAIGHVHKVEDVLTRVVGSAYTNNDHRTFG